MNRNSDALAGKRLKPVQSFVGDLTRKTIQLCKSIGMSSDFLPFRQFVRTFVHLESEINGNSSNVNTSYNKDKENKENKDKKWSFGF